MSTVRVQESHSLPADQVRGRLGAFEDDLRKWGAKLVWKGDRAAIKGTGVKGAVVVSPGRIEVTVKLGLLAKAAGVDPKKLQASIERRIKAAVASDPQDG